jgi:hypothetical protein
VPVITPLDGFSSDRAWAHVEALAAIGPRPAGSPQSAAARGYIQRELARNDGVTVEETATTVGSEGAEALALTHVVATIHGASLDRFVLAASYDGEATQDAGSGAALLLELARLLDEASLPYSVELLFVEGEGDVVADAAAPRVGAERLAEAMHEAGRLDGVRLLVAFHRVCDPDLEIARDLSSHRHHREAFFDAARALGHGDVFRPDRGFESVDAMHVAFARRGVRPVVGRGVRPVVAIVDTSRGASDLDGAAGSAECVPESLDIVGTVTLAALDRIGRRLAKIDRFTEMPLADADADGAGAPPAADDDAREEAQGETAGEDGA